MDTPSCTPLPSRARTGSTERRRGDRHRLDIPATLVPTGADGLAAERHGRPLPTVVTAFSVNGVGLRVAQPLAVGDVYALSTFDSLIPPGLRVRIRSQRITPAGDHEVGAEVV
jgi:hypothetical protein